MGRAVFLEGDFQKSMGVLHVPRYHLELLFRHCLFMAWEEYLKKTLSACSFWLADAPEKKTGKPIHSWTVN